MSLPQTRISLIVAAAENGVIGRGGQMPWRIPSDLKRFRALTMGKPMIMGRKQYQSVGRPLDGRDNIVLTRDRGFQAAGVLVSHALDEALELARGLARARGCDEIMVIGGGEIYQLTLPVADRIYLTRVHARPEGDVRFPDLDEPVWQETRREQRAGGPTDDFHVTDLVLERIGSPP